MKTVLRLITLGVFLPSLHTAASDFPECNDLKYVGANKLSVLIGIQDINPRYTACVSATSFRQAYKDLDAQHQTEPMSDEKFREQASDIGETQEESRYAGISKYSNATAVTYRKKRATNNKDSSAGLSFGNLNKPISTASGYKTLSGNEPR